VRLHKKTKRTVSPSTIAAWLREYKQHCTYRRLRANGRARFPATQTIRSIKLYHRQVYAYAYHRPKLDFLRTDFLDDKRAASAASTARFAPVADFLEAIPTACPHELFTRDEDPKARASQARPAFADGAHAIVNRKENAATEAAALIIPAVGNNKLRHETLQRFMLANDSVTLAVEIPIWLTENDIDAIERHYAIELAPKTGVPRAITGHLDFLQVRNGAVHILDYKPDARPTNRSPNLRSMHSRSPASPASTCSTSNARGSTSTNIASSFPARFCPAAAKCAAPADRDRPRTGASSHAGPRPFACCLTTVAVDLNRVFPRLERG
jgi:hypothetical protein